MTATNLYAEAIRKAGESLPGATATRRGVVVWIQIDGRGAYLMPETLCGCDSETIRQAFDSMAGGRR